MKGENWDFALLTCLCLVFFRVDASSVELPQPENLSLSWSSNGFKVTANWSEPAGLDCKVIYELKHTEEYNSHVPLHEWRTKSLNHSWDTDRNKACISVITVPDVCENKTPSKPLVKCLLPRPEGVVKDFNCVYYSHMKMNCTWSLISQASDLQLFYGNESNTLKPCVTYIENGSTRTGCHLFGEEFVLKTLYFLVNGTRGGAAVESNFIRDLKNSVKIPPPKLNIIREDKRLRFQSSVPDFKQGCWEYEFYYKKCAEPEIGPKVVENANYTVEYDETCRYTVRVRARLSKYCGEGGSEISEPEYFGEDGDPNRLTTLALILTPIIVSCCLIVAIVLCRRYKDDIFPKIPEPSLLFKDMLSSNRERDVNVGRLYVPDEEVVEKKISLEPDSAALLQI